MHPHDDVCYIYKGVLKHGDSLEQQQSWLAAGRKTGRYKVKMTTQFSDRKIAIILSSEWRNTYGDGYDKIDDRERGKGPIRSFVVWAMEDTWIGKAYRHLLRDRGENRR